LESDDLDEDSDSVVRTSRAELRPSRLKFYSVPKYLGIPVDADPALGKLWRMKSLAADRSNMLRESMKLCMGSAKSNRNPLVEEAFCRVSQNRMSAPVSRLIGASSLRGQPALMKLRFEMPETDLEIRRTFEYVPANLPLRALQDKLICPAFNWERIHSWEELCLSSGVRFQLWAG